MVPHFFLLLFVFTLTVRLDLSKHGCFQQNRGIIIIYQAEHHKNCSSTKSQQYPTGLMSVISLANFGALVHFPSCGLTWSPWSFGLHSVLLFYIIHDLSQINNTSINAMCCCQWSCRPVIRNDRLEISVVVCIVDSVNVLNYIWWCCLSLCYSVLFNHKFGTEFEYIWHKKTKMHSLCMVVLKYSGDESEYACRFS